MQPSGFVTLPVILSHQQDTAVYQERDCPEILPDGWRALDGPVHVCTVAGTYPASWVTVRLVGRERLFRGARVWPGTGGD